MGENNSNLKTAKAWIRRSPQMSHLLVDLDGTLLGAYDLPLRIEFTAKALAELRKYGSWFKSISTLRAIQTALETPSLYLTNENRTVKTLSEQFGLTLEKAHQVLNEVILLLFPKMERYFFPVRGAKDFLIWAKDRYPMILATNPVWTEEIVKMRMKWADIDPSLFQSITHSGRMHACKPSVDYFLEILEQEKLNSNQCFFIGNDPKKDLPATQAGIPVFILSRSNQLSPLTLKGQKAPAWKGSFKNLRTILEQS